MTIKEFCKIMFEYTCVKVIDEYSVVGEYDVDELQIVFNKYTRIIEIKAYDYDMVVIRIDRVL